MSLFTSELSLLTTQVQSFSKVWKHGWIYIRLSRASSVCKKTNSICLCAPLGISGISPGPFCVAITDYPLRRSPHLHTRRASHDFLLLPTVGSKAETWPRLSWLPAHEAALLHWKLLEPMDCFQIFIKRFTIHILDTKIPLLGTCPKNPYCMINTDSSHRHMQCRPARWGWGQFPEASDFLKAVVLPENGLSGRFNKGYLQSICNYLGNAYVIKLSGGKHRIQPVWSPPEKNRFNSISQSLVMWKNSSMVQALWKTRR